MKYTIKLSNMEFRAFHGCYLLEQQVGNRFSVNLEIDTWQDDIAADRVENAVSYLTVYEVVREQMKITQNTIETVALNIINALKSQFTQIDSVTCEVAKIAPPLGGKIERVSVILRG